MSARPQPHRLGDWLTARRLLDVLVPAALVAVALVPLYPAYGALPFVLVAATGILAGTVIAVAGAVRRWSTLTVVAVTLVAFFALGGQTVPASAIAGIIPTPQTWQLMGRGMVTVWKEVLTVTPPLGATGSTLLLPYLLGFLGALVAVTLSTRARHHSLALIPPSVVAVASILFGTRHALAPGIIAMAGVLAGVVWVAWRAGRLDSRRVLALPVVLGVAVIGGTGASLVMVPDAPRLVLRDHVEPPPDPQDYPSPLAGMRRYVDTLAEETMFTASSVPEGVTRLRIATMDSYDGRVWNIAGGGSPSSGTFSRVGDRLSDSDATGQQVEVTVAGYRDVWVPNVGGTLDVDFEGARAQDLSDGLFFNRATDTGLAVPGLREGDQVTVEAAPPQPPPEEDRAALVVEDVRQPSPTDVPDEVGSLASRLTQNVSGDYPRVEALAEALSSQGYFSHGLEGSQPSRAGHGAARLLEMIEDTEKIIGDQEQYSALMALMVRSLGLPARVVFGFDVSPGDSQITGEDVTAWVEVPFEGEGWLPFDPTPPEDQEPITEVPDPEDKPQPQVLQPPDPPVAPGEVPNQEREEVEPDDQHSDPPAAMPQWLQWAVVAGVPALVLLMPPLLIAALKLRRRHRRRTRGPGSDRIAGGWSEVADTAADLGYVGAGGLTRSESASGLEAHFSGAETLTLAREADAGVFGPAEPEPEQVEAYWERVAAARSSLRAGSPLRRRIRALVSIRSLRRRRR